jgi:phi13 family phage major tail protein
MSNKIKYGLKNVYYAVATIAADGSATYETPVAIPGAVSLSMEPQGENSPFYADNIVYWVGTSNTGYEGDLELALVIDAFKKDILGYQDDTKHVLVEDANANAVHFALLFQFEGDVKATRHVLYNCTATRPGAAGSTKEASVEPETESVTVTATTVYNASYDSDIVKADTTEETDATTYSGWFTQVYIPTKTP